MTYKPLVIRLPEERDTKPTGVDQHCQRLLDKRTQGQRRITGLQDKIRATRNGFLLVRVKDGVAVHWDDVRLTVHDGIINL